MGEFEHKPFDGIGADTNIPTDSEREFSAKIADVDIRDDFMFSYVMCNRQICTELLQYLLPDRKISRIEYYELGEDGTEQPESASQKGEPLKLDTQKSLNEAFNRRTVRLDVYIDDGKSVYNLEMQTTRHAGLAKRARLYQAHMDINQLQRGQFYTRLRPSFVIFICTFDPFDEGRYLYSFRNVCRETGAELDDEAYKLFFNTAGTRGQISDSLREILRYMNDPKSYPVDKAELPLIRSIDEAVGEAKMSNEWRHAYMIYQIHQQDAELRGEERGEKRNMVKTAAVFKIFCKCAKRGTQRISRARGLRLRACANAATASAAWPWQVAGEMLKWGTDGRPMKVLIPVTVGTISIAFSRRSVKAGVERTLSLRPRMVNRRSACQDT